MLAVPSSVTKIFPVAVIDPSIAEDCTISTSIPTFGSEGANVGVEATSTPDFEQPPVSPATESKINRNLCWNMSRIPSQRPTTSAAASRSQARDRAATNRNRKLFDKNQPAYRVACGSHRAAQASSSRRFLARIQSTFEFH